MKCCGNCAVCDLNVDKAACCQVQILRNVIEVKHLLQQQKAETDYTAIAEIETNKTTE